VSQASPPDTLRPVRSVSFWSRLWSGNLSDREFAVILFAPAVILLAGIFLYPTVQVVFSSFNVQDASDPRTSTVGIQNFQRMLSDDRFGRALLRTLGYGVLTVGGSFLIGLPLALLANVESPLKWLVRVALLLPWAMPQVITGLMFRWLFNFDYGLFNDLISRVGLSPPLWLSIPPYAITAIVVTVIWKTSSFVALILLGGLQSIPHELTEAARVDGANGWQAFWRITLPLLRPAIAVALIFRTLSAIQVFDIPYALIGDGAGGAGETLGVYIQKTLVEFLEPGYGAVLSLGLFAVSIVITVFYLRFIRPEDS
jgi:multiple sugar transport system permease protein